MSTRTGLEVGASVTDRGVRWRRFARHLGEMVIAMLLGMAVLGGAVEGVLALAGTSLSDGAGSLRAAVMATTMTVPMVWWMRRRGHSIARSIEMAGAMVVPTVLAIGLYEAQLLGSDDALLSVQHLAMFPSMLGVMLWRLDHYTA